ncbi:MAG: histidinol-phosphate transaminase [Cellulosilyticaceae bacterium]
MNPYIKARLRPIKPYHATYRTAGIFLDANESSASTLEQLTEHMKNWLDTAQLSRYPDSDTRQLREAISKAHEVPYQQIICGVGSDQLIDCLLRSVLEEGDCVMAPEPSFSMYALTTQINGGIFRGVPLTDAFTYNFEQLYQDVCAQQPKVLFICTPNNPTGSVLSVAQIEKLIQVSMGVVVVDEAYIEFGGETAIPLVKAYPNVLVLRTFSKAYGLAGARVGYGIGSGAVIEAMLGVKPPYHLNRFSQEVATWVIQHRDAFKQGIDQIRGERERVYRRLYELGYEAYPSEANFIWMKGNKLLLGQLEAQQIFIKCFACRGEDYYRVTIGSERENTTFLQKCEEVAYALCTDQSGNIRNTN